MKLLLTYNAVLQYVFMMGFRIKIRICFRWIFYCLLLMMSRRRSSWGNFWRLGGRRRPIGLLKDSYCIKIKKVRKRGMLDMMDMLLAWGNNNENFHSTQITIKDSNKSTYKTKEMKNNKTNPSFSRVLTFTKKMKETQNKIINLKNSIQYYLSWRINNWICLQLKKWLKIDWRKPLI